MLWRKMRAALVFNCRSGSVAPTRIAAYLQGRDGGKSSARRRASHVKRTRLSLRRFEGDALSLSRLIPPLE